MIVTEQDFDRVISEAWQLMARCKGIATPEGTRLIEIAKELDQWADANMPGELLQIEKTLMARVREAVEEFS